MDNLAFWGLPLSHLLNTDWIYLLCHVQHSASNTSDLNDGSKFLEGNDVLPFC